MSPKYEPPSLDVEDVVQINKVGSFLGRNPVVKEESESSTSTSSPYSPTRLWGSDAGSPSWSEPQKIQAIQLDSKKLGKQEEVIFEFE